MKQIKGFIICVSTSIFILILMPFALIFLKSETAFYFYIFFAVISFVFMLAFGIKNIVKSRQLFKQNNIKDLNKMWVGMKLLNVPVFILNFFVCLIIISVGFILFPLNIIVTVTNSVYVFMCVILSGVVGITAIKAIKKEGGKIHPVFSVMQVIPFWDVISTVITEYTMR